MKIDKKVVGNILEIIGLTNLEKVNRKLTKIDNEETEQVFLDNNITLQEGGSHDNYYSIV